MGSILIIDDDKHIRYLLKVALEPMGHQIVEATNGKEVLTILQDSSPSLMIIDILMPELDGIELVRDIRRTKTDKKSLRFPEARLLKMSMS